MAEPLSILLSVATGLALAAAAGFRAFVPLLAAGLAIHFGYVEPARGFDWLGDPVVLAALSIATVTEIAAYYIPGSTTRSTSSARRSPSAPASSPRPA